MVPAPAAGCRQFSNRADHRWRIGGCFQQAGPGTLVTDQAVNLDGAELIPEDSGTIEVTGIGGPGARVISTDPAAVNLVVNGLEVLLNHVTLDWTLSGVRIRLAVPDGIVVAGIPIAGTLILTAESDGTMTGTVSATLPEILSGAHGTLSITSVYGIGVTAMRLSAAHASLAGLFRIDYAELSWSPSGWLVQGSATIPSGLGPAWAAGWISAPMASSDRGTWPSTGYPWPASSISARSRSPTSARPAGPGRPASPTRARARTSRSASPAVAS